MLPKAANAIHARTAHLATIAQNAPALANGRTAAHDRIVIQMLRGNHTVALNRVRQIVVNAEPAVSLVIATFKTVVTPVNARNAETPTAVPPMATGHNEATRVAVPHKAYAQIAMNAAINAHRAVTNRAVTNRV